jgi:2-phospho-L-lactate guanylyltransferase (CobY/MobA/RfbA family)
VLAQPGLALDIDAADDLAALLERGAGTHAHRLLDAWGVRDRLAAAGAAPAR